MLQKAYFLAKIGADTAENEQHFAGHLLQPGPLEPEDRPVSDADELDLRAVLIGAIYA